MHVFVAAECRSEYQARQRESGQRGLWQKRARPSPRMRANCMAVKRHTEAEPGSFSTMEKAGDEEKSECEAEKKSDRVAEYPNIKLSKTRPGG